MHVTVYRFMNNLAIMCNVLDPSTEFILWITPKLDCFHTQLTPLYDSFRTGSLVQVTIDGFLIVGITTIIFNLLLLHHVEHMRSTHLKMVFKFG